MFHASCLVHWILMCEYDIITNRLALPIVRRRTKRKRGENVNQNGKECQMNDKGKINSVFCPECQGTGINIDGDRVEHAPFSLSEVCSLHDFLLSSPFSLSYSFLLYLFIVVKLLSSSLLFSLWKARYFLGKCSFGFFGRCLNLR